MKVLSFNVYGPPLAANKKERMKIIAKEIIKLSPDIIMLQELIMPGSWKIITGILTNSGYFINQKRRLFYFGGSLIATKKQVAHKSNFVKFNNQGSILTFWEHLLPKGFRYLNYNDAVLINAQLICIYRYSNREISVHANQLEQLSGFVNSLPKKKKVILSGDFNRTPDTPEMKRFMKQTGLKNRMTEKFVTHNPNNLKWNISLLNKTSNNNFFNPQRSFGEKLIDYTFCRGFENKSITHQKIFDRPYKINGDTQYLSDHYGVLTEIS